MHSDSSNDNAAMAHRTDPHGQAAILLVESLLHGLIARQVITVADAVEIVDIAAEVKTDVAGDMGDSPGNLQKSLALLTAISSSLTRDVSDG